MFASARKALQSVFDPAFRGIVLKSLALTVLLFAGLFWAAQYGLAHIPPLSWPWLNTALDLLASALLLVAMVLLGAPVAALFGSLFLDEIAEEVEKTYYPADPPATGASFWAGLTAGLRLTFWLILFEIVLMPLNLLQPEFAWIDTLVLNGWLLGREFFELAALRHMSAGAARTLRRRYRFGVWGAGLLLAALSLVPVVNLFVPLFGAAFMVHLFKRYSHEGRPVR